MESKRFVSSLHLVSDSLGVPYRIVIQWRDEDACPFLLKSPYDVTAIHLWLSEKAKRELDPMSPLTQKKIEAELEKMERDKTIFSKDKVWWLAAVMAGVTVTKSVLDYANPQSSAIKPENTLQFERILYISDDSTTPYLESLFRSGYDVVPVLFREYTFRRKIALRIVEENCFQYTFMNSAPNEDQNDTMEFFLELLKCGEHRLGRVCFFRETGVFKGTDPEYPSLPYTHKFFLFDTSQHSDRYVLHLLQN